MYCVFVVFLYQFSPPLKRCGQVSGFTIGKLLCFLIVMTAEEKHSGRVKKKKKAFLFKG